MGKKVRGGDAVDHQSDHPNKRKREYKKEGGTENSCICPRPHPHPPPPPKDVTVQPTDSNVGSVASITTMLRVVNRNKTHSRGKTKEMYKEKVKVAEADQTCSDRHESENE